MNSELIIKRLKELFDTDRSKTLTARKLDVSRATIYYWLQGRTKSLDIDTLKKIAKTYGVNLQWILGDSEKKWIELPQSHEYSSIKKEIIDKLDYCSESDLKKLKVVIDTFLSNN